jgi:hypothetical protein
MKYLFLTLISLALISCEEGTDPNNQVENPNAANGIHETLDKRIAHHVETTLSILGTEKYSLKTYSEDLNGDDSLDMIITVNLMPRALKEAEESGQVAKKAEIGFMGAYNFFFYLDGASKDISSAIPVPSSPHAELKIDFEHIKSAAYKDVLVDYRIRNSCYRRFFTIVNRGPLKTFEQKLYDGLGTENTEAYAISYTKGSYNLAKDIIVYKATLENTPINEPDDIYFVNPKITPTDQIQYRWFFNARDLKYYMEKGN